MFYAAGKLYTPGWYFQFKKSINFNSYNRCRMFSLPLWLKATMIKVHMVKEGTGFIDVNVNRLASGKLD
jgi:hypothetical protein